MFKLDGKKALVTGAATGLGQAIAVALARQGADVAVSDLPGVSLDDTLQKVQAFENKSYTLELDVRDVASLDAIIENLSHEFGSIDILVNNAGINRPKAGLDVTEENWDDHYNTNIKGGFFLAQKLAPAMIEQGWGRIIWISSQSGLIGIPGQPVYCSTKGAVIQAVRTLGVEWAKHGITVNSVAPTFVETDLTRTRLQDPEFRAFVLGKIPRGELASSEDVASATVYLASREAGMVNCVTLPVDGGWTAW
ncbi:MAG: SDR family oxidoreductase [Holophagae bacterium]|nr:SDR family oxidoreductase [Holophagae bacterium]